MIGENKFDIAIVGQGIAGTLMAYFLSKHGKKVLIIDNDFHGASSMVAAGIVNPVTGKNYNISWKIKDLLPVALETYHDLSQTLGIQTFTKSNIVRALYNAEDENTWLSRTSDPFVGEYITSTDITEFEGKVGKSYSYGELTQTFYVHLKEILHAYKELYIAKNAYFVHKFDHSLLSPQEIGFLYKGFIFDEIVFCEGHAATQNVFFPEIGLAPAKGEALIIKIEGNPFSKMFKDGIFIIPQGDEKYWVGSGYEWDYTDDKPSTIAYQKLFGELQRILKVPFEVLDHQAAIRPTMHKRTPIFLKHPSITGMYLFNGLGTKGASIGPYLARQFTRYIVKKNPTDLKL